MIRKPTGFGRTVHLPGLLFLFFVLTPPAQARGVVSLNLCTDEYLVLLAPDSIAALSPLAGDPTLSVVAAKAARLPRIRADAEAVLALKPALILAGTYGAQTVLSALRQRGARVVQVAEATNFDGVAATIVSLADVLGVPARGAALVAAMRARLARIEPAPKGRAILWEAHGLSAGPGSFGDAVLREAGLVNAGTGGHMGIETLVAHPPDLLVTAAAPAYPSLATSLLTHPALARLRRRTIDTAWLACPGPWSTAAVAALAR